MIAFLVSLSLHFGAQARASNLYAPFLLESAQTLPKNRWSAAITFATATLRGRFGGEGKAERFEDYFQRELSWAQILEQVQDPLDKKLAKHSIREAGINEETDQGPGSVVGSLNARFFVTAPSLFYGLTERWTSGLVLPIIRIESSGNMGFRRSENGQRWVQHLCQLNPSGCEQATENINQALKNQLNAHSYDPLGETDRVLLGDLQWINRFALVQTHERRWGIKLGLQFPSGSKPDLRQFVNAPVGESGILTNLGTTLEWKVIPHLRSVTGLGGFFKTPGRIQMRIPKSNQTLLSGDTETLVRRVYGGWTLTQALQVEHEPTGLSAAVGYLFQHTMKRSFEPGQRFEKERYNILNKQMAAQMLHSLVAQIQFSAIQLYQEGHLPAPFSANVTMGVPLGGTYAFSDTTLALQLFTFF